MLWDRKNRQQTDVAGDDKGRDKDGDKDKEQDTNKANEVDEKKGNEEDDSDEGSKIRNKNEGKQDIKDDDNDSKDGEEDKKESIKEDIKEDIKEVKVKNVIRSITDDYNSETKDENEEKGIDQDSKPAPPDGIAEKDEVDKDDKDTKIENVQHDDTESNDKEEKTGEQETQVAPATTRQESPQITESGESSADTTNSDAIADDNSNPTLHSNVPSTTSTTTIRQTGRLMKILAFLCTVAAIVIIAVTLTDKNRNNRSSNSSSNVDVNDPDGSDTGSIKSTGRNSNDTSQNNVADGNVESPVWWQSNVMLVDLPDFNLRLNYAENINELLNGSNDKSTNTSSVEVSPRSNNKNGGDVRRLEDAAGNGSINDEEDMDMLLDIVNEHMLETLKTSAGLSTSNPDYSITDVQYKISKDKSTNQTRHADFILHNGKAAVVQNAPTENPNDSTNSSTSSMTADDMAEEFQETADMAFVRLERPFMEMLRQSGVPMLMSAENVTFLQPSPSDLDVIKIEDVDAIRPENVTAVVVPTVVCGDKIPGTTTQYLGDFPSRCGDVGLESASIAQFKLLGTGGTLVLSTCNEHFDHQYNSGIVVLRKAFITDVEFNQIEYYECVMGKSSTYDRCESGVLLEFDTVVDANYAVLVVGDPAMNHPTQSIYNDYGYGFVPTNFDMEQKYPSPSTQNDYKRTSWPSTSLPTYNSSIITNIKTSREQSNTGTSNHIPEKVQEERQSVPYYFTRSPVSHPSYYSDNYSPSNYNTNSGKHFVLEVHCIPDPALITCSADGSSTTFSGSTLGLPHSSINLPDCSYSKGATDGVVKYVFIPDSDREVILHTCHETTDFYTSIRVFRQTGTNNDSVKMECEVSGETFSKGICSKSANAEGASFVSFFAEKGVYYEIVVSSTSWSYSYYRQQGVFALTLSCPLPRESDTHIEEVGCGNSYSGSTLNLELKSSGFSSPHCNEILSGYTGRAEYTLVGNGEEVILSTCNRGSNFDSALSVFKKEEKQDGAYSYYNEDYEYVYGCGQSSEGHTCGFPQYSDYSYGNYREERQGTGGIVSIMTEKDLEYIIQVGGSKYFSMQEGNFTLDVICPSNISSEKIACGESVINSTIGLQPSSLQLPYCGEVSNESGFYGSVVYSIVGNGHEVILSTCTEETDFDTAIRVFRNNGNHQTNRTNSTEDLNCIDSNTYFSNCPHGYEKAVSSFYAQNQVEYIVYISGTGNRYSQRQGNFQLDVSCPSMDIVNATMSCGQSVNGEIIDVPSFLSLPYCGNVDPSVGFFGSETYKLIGTGTEVVLSTCDSTFSTQSELSIRVMVESPSKENGYHDYYHEDIYEYSYYQDTNDYDYSYYQDTNEFRCIAGNRYFPCPHSKSGSVVSFLAQTNVTYYVIISNANGEYNSRLSASYKVQVICPAKSEPQDLKCGDVVSNSTKGLGPSSMNYPYCNIDSSSGFTGSVSYSFTGNGSEVILSTCNKETYLDTEIRVYENNNISNVPSLAPISYNDYDYSYIETSINNVTCKAGASSFYTCPHGNDKAVVSFIAQKNTSYTIFVTGNGDREQDSFALEAICTESQVVEEISCGMSINGSTYNLPPSSLQLPYCYFSAEIGFWGSMTYSLIGQGEQVTLSTCNKETNFDTSIRVFTKYDWTWDNSMQCVAGNAGICLCSHGDKKGVVTFFAEKDQEYEVVVSTFNAYSSKKQGDFRLDVTCPSEEKIESTELFCGNSINESTVGLLPSSTWLPYCSQVSSNVGISGAVHYTITGNDEEFILSTCSEETDFYSSIRVYDMSQQYCVESSSYFSSCSHGTNQGVVSFFAQKNKKYDIYVSGSSYCSNAINQGNFNLNVFCPKSIAKMSKQGVDCAQQVVNTTEGLMPSTMLLSSCYADNHVGFTGALAYSIVGKGNEIILSTCNSRSEISSSIRVFSDNYNKGYCVAGSSYFSSCSTETNSGVVSFLAESDKEYTVLVSGGSSSYENGKRGIIALDVICPEKNLTMKSLDCGSSHTDSTIGLEPSSLLYPYCHMDSSVGFLGSFSYSLIGDGKEVIVSTCNSKDDFFNPSIRVYYKNWGRLECVTGSTSYYGCRNGQKSVVSFIAKYGVEYEVIISSGDYSKRGQGNFQLDVFCPKTFDVEQVFDGEEIIGSTVNSAPSSLQLPYCGGADSSSGFSGSSSYKYIGEGQEVFLSTCSSYTNFDTAIRVFNRDTQIPSCVSTSTTSLCSQGRTVASFYGEEGSEYEIIISGKYGIQGNYKLSVFSAER